MDWGWRGKREIENGRLGDQMGRKGSELGEFGGELGVKRKRGSGVVGTCWQAIRAVAL